MDYFEGPHSFGKSTITARYGYDVLKNLKRIIKLITIIFHSSYILINIVVSVAESRY